MRALAAQLATVSVPCICTDPGPGHGYFCPRMRMLRALAKLERVGQRRRPSMTMHDRLVVRGERKYGFWTWDGDQWRVMLTETEDENESS